MVDGFELKVGDKVQFNYMNMQGTVGNRVATIRRIWFGTTTWQPDPGILVEAIDSETDKTRYFYAMDMTDMKKVD